VRVPHSYAEHSGMNPNALGALRGWPRYVSGYWH